MTSFKTSLTSIEKIFIILVFSELLLGGSGHIFAVGPISLRILFLAGMVFVDLLLLVKGKIIANPSNIILFCILSYFAGVLFYSILNNNFGDVVDTFLGYIVIIVCPVFIYLFNKNTALIFTAKKVFYVCTFILSILTVIIWIYCLIFGVAVYYQIQGLFDRFQYGALAFVGPIPRVFLKGSIFICCGLFLSVMEFFQTYEVKKLFLSIIYAVAIIMTFTTSFYVFTAGILFIVLFHVIGKERFVKFLEVIIVLTVIGVLIAIKAGILQIFIERFSGDYNFSYKGIQLMTIMKHAVKRPLFGNGFGYSIYIDYGYIARLSYSFEVMWAQLFLDTGIIGVSLISAHIGITLYDLFKNYRVLKNNMYYAFALSVVFICLVSFTNPFMNNAIGLLFYSFCVGMSTVDGEYIRHMNIRNTDAIVEVN